jgi:hypothetical protein
VRPMSRHGEALTQDDASTEPSRNLPTFDRHPPRWHTHARNVMWLLLIAVCCTLFGGIGGLVARAVPVRLQGCIVMCCAQPGKKP